MYNYLKNYIPVNKMYKEIQATSTVENALYTKKMIRFTKIKNIYVLTSDFHIDRSEYIFENIFNYYKIKPENVINPFYNIYMISAETPIDKIEMIELKKKETIFISYLKELKNIGKI